jgi:hypothetical protein
MQRMNGALAPGVAASGRERAGVNQKRGLTFEPAQKNEIPNTTAPVPMDCSRSAAVACWMAEDFQPEAVADSPAVHSDSASESYSVVASCWDSYSGYPGLGYLDLRLGSSCLGYSGSVSRSDCFHSAPRSACCPACSGFVASDFVAAATVPSADSRSLSEDSPIPSVEAQHDCSALAIPNQRSNLHSTRPLALILCPARPEPPPTLRRIEPQQIT